MKDHDHSVIIKKVDKVSPTQVVLSLEFEGEHVRKEEERTARKVGRQAAIAGFRPGKAPLQMVRAKYKTQIEKDMLSTLLERGLVEALEETKLVPINQPRVRFEEAPELTGKPFGFEARFEVEPEVELKEYKGIPVKATHATVSDDEVEKSIEVLRERLATLEPCEAERAEKGLFAVVELGFELLEEPRTKEERKAMLVELGAGKFLPELESSFLEMKPGDERKIESAFPADFGRKEFAGKRAAFDCKLVELKRRVLPVLDDAFAGQVSEGKTLEQLKWDIRDNILRAKTSEHLREQRKEITDYLVAVHPFEVPASMVERRLQSLVRWVYEDMKRRGIENPPELKPDQIEELRKSAEYNVKSGLVLKEIAQKESIVLDTNRVQQKVESVATELKRSVEEVEQLLTKNGILDQFRDEILTDQVFEFLIKNSQEVESSPRPND